MPSISLEQGVHFSLPSYYQSTNHNLIPIAKVKSTSTLSERDYYSFAIPSTVKFSSNFFKPTNQVKSIKMALIPSFSPFNTLTNYNLNNDFSNQSLSNLRQEAIKPLAPLMSADLIESENDYQIHVDLPGVENLQINTENQILSIEAERKIQHEEQSDIAHTLERSYGKVKRRLRLPSNADVDRATAKYKDGVLSVSFPKKANGEGQRKKLTIE